MTDTSPANAGRMLGGRFRKGTSGNPAGKVRGTRNKVTIAVEGLMGKYGEQVAARMVKRAVDGDVGAARLILDRVAPVRRGRAVHLKIGEIGDAASVMNVHAALLTEVAAGRLTPEEAEPFSAMLGAHLKAIETTDIDRRLRNLESRAAAQK